MEYMNINMKKLKDKLCNDLNAIKNIDVSQIENIKTPNIVESGECFILDIKNNLDTENINWERVMKFHRDKTGYEASCNELRVNDYIQNTDETTVLLYAFQTMDGWEKQLKDRFPQHKFILILSYDQGYATLRFHKKREDESNWLSADLEKYKQQAILVKEL
ncbi:hypothetical protein [Bacillus changyiensis]|uniref:hypothetical protein n=1 Tax=Bacillus changyiensis TaxID=3004103 RepID=UPI0022E472A9|nr:hypothetical protein [Bacillus changyiensis]MDA1476423.1 hypothetical protein [Bacillus changyiensis]